MSEEALAIVGRLLATILLILANALFVFHEFAFVTIKPAQARRLERESSTIGRLITRGVHRLDHYIAVDQLGITATSIAVGWIGQPLVAGLLAQPLRMLGVLEPPAVLVISAAIAFALIIGTQMLGGELMPKTVALRYPERTAKLVVLPVELVAILMHPVVLVLNGLGRLASRLFVGATPRAGSHVHVLPTEELAAVIAASARAGVLAADPRTIRQALRFSDFQARDLMVPREDVTALDARLSVEEVLAVAREAMHTRYPVYEGTLDNVVGVLNVKDLVKVDGNIRMETNWRRLVRPIPALPEVASIEGLLQRLSEQKQHMALLIDEYGGTAGIITVSDVAERLIGEPADLRRLAKGHYVLPGEANVAMVETELGISLGPAEREYDTVGGLVMTYLGRIPAAGDRVEVAGHEFAVVAMKGKRVTKVELRIAVPSAEDDREAARSE